MSIKKIDNIIEKVFDEINNLPIGGKGTIMLFVNNVTENNSLSAKEMFDIQKRILELCKKNGIILDYSKWENQDVGLPFNLEFIKKKI